MTESTSSIIKNTLIYGWKYWKPNWIYGVVIIVTLLLGTLFTSYLAFCLKFIIDALTKNQGFESIKWIITGLISGYIVAAVAHFYSGYITTLAQTKILNRISRTLWQHLQTVPVSTFYKISTGDLMSRFSNDLKALRKGFTIHLPSGVVYFVSFFINVPLLLFLDWKLSIITLVLIPLLTFAISKMSPLVVSQTYKTNIAQANILDTLQSYLSAQKFIKSYNLQRLAISDLNKELDEFEATKKKEGWYDAMTRSLAKFGAHGFSVFTITIGAFFVLSGSISIGSLVAFITILKNTNRSFIKLTSDIFPAILKAYASILRIEELMSIKGNEQLEVKKEVTLSVKKGILFKDVSFSYDKKNTTLDCINLEFKPKQLISIVGASGSGKSTVLSLIPRFYDPGAGQILFDEQDISKYPHITIRNVVSTVFQDTYLFDISIMENIRIARPTATDNEIKAAAKAAEIHDFIQTLPQGYNTPVGTGGGLLSGGQKQRIAIARALIRKTPILLLDEATSALDITTERAINRTIVGLKAEHTIISVTHRLSAITNSDQIFVLDQGKLVESGSHQRLLDKKGFYRHLWDKQQGFEVSEDGGKACISPDRLKQIDLFDSLNKQELTQLANQFTSKQIKNGEIVFSQGDKADHFYVIVRGKINVSIEQKQVATLEDGDFFGEIAFLEKQNRNATLTAVTNGLLITLSKIAFESLLAHKPKVKMHIQKVANSRL